VSISDEDCEKICEAVGMADFVDGRVVLPTVDALVREVEFARSALDANNKYWIGRTGPTQGDLDRQAARLRCRAVERSEE
jgi:hypothetical protein